MFAVLRTARGCLRPCLVALRGWQILFGVSKGAIQQTMMMASTMPTMLVGDALDVWLMLRTPLDEDGGLTDRAWFVLRLCPITSSVFSEPLVRRFF